MKQLTLLGLLLIVLIRGQAQVSEDIILAPVEVTGTRLLGFEKSVFSKIELTTFEIEQTGAATVGDWLQSLSINTGGLSSFASNPTSDAAARQGINFRGLGGSASLVLINGLRIAPMGLLDGSALPIDVGALPLGALESAEVLLDGSVATYGADAVGGVVNLRTRRDYNGGQAKVAFRQFEDTDWGRLEASFVQGFSGDHHSLLLAADFATNHDVRFGDRPVSQTEDLRGAGGKDLRSTFAFPAFVNLPHSGVAPELAGKLVGLGTTSPNGAVTWAPPNSNPQSQNFVEVPANVLPDGTPRPGDSRTAFDQAPYTSMIPAEDMFGLWASGRAEVTPIMEALIDLAWRRRVQDGAIQPVTVSLRNEGAQGVGDGPNGEVILPASSPYNPFGVDLEDVRFSLEELGSRHRVFTNEVVRIVAGLEGKIGADTDWTSGALWTRNKVDETAENYLTDQALQDGLSGRLGGYLNPFGPSDPGVIDQAWTELRNVQDYTLQQIDLRAQHSFTLSDTGPEWIVGAGAEWRDEVFRARPTALAEVRGYVGWGVPATRTLKRETLAAHAELGMREWHGWVIHCGIRAEHNEDYGTAWTPQIGLSYEVRPGLFLRARRAELFRPPELSITNSKPITYTSTVHRDPERPELGSYNVQYTAGANRDLDPEETTAWRAGIAWEVGSDRRIIWSADFWRYEQQGLITRYGTQNILDYEAANPGTFTDRIIRDPVLPDGRPGAIRQIKDSYINLNQAMVQGWDFACAGNWIDSRGTKWRLDLMTTYLMLHVLDDPLRGTRHLAGETGRPHWQGNATLAYLKGHWDGSVHAQYIGGQNGDGYTADGDADLDSRIFTNLSIGWRPKPQLRIGLAVTNLFDIDPPIQFDNPRGYTPGKYSNRGRGYAVTLEQTW